MNDGGNIGISPLNSDIVFCVGNLYYNSTYYPAVSHTSDGGSTWEHDTLFGIGSNAWAIAFDPVDVNRVYVAGDSASNYPFLAISTDLGRTWSQSRTGLASKVWCLSIDPTDAQTIYAGTNNGVYKSTNAGQTWSATGLTLQTRALVIDPDRPNNVYAGTYTAGVYASADYGATWTPMNNGLSFNKILSMALRPGTEPVLYAGTDGGAVFRTMLSTVLAERPTHISPASAVTVMPNPCRAQAALRLAAHPTADCRLTILDAAGRIVYSCAPRTRVVRLNTERLAPGAYFVRCTDGAKIGFARLTIVE